MTTEIAECEESKPLRADAARNRELILRTAAEVFAEHGLEAGYDEIARRAGIGVGTVYRRFPERSELVQALFESRIQEILAVAEEAGRNKDPFDGLAWFLEAAVERQVADRGLKEVLVSDICQDEHRMVGRERIGPILEQIVARAQAAGTLRSRSGHAGHGDQLDEHAGTARSVEALPRAAHRRSPVPIGPDDPPAVPSRRGRDARPDVQHAGSLTRLSMPPRWPLPQDPPGL
jgi:AcrR family transcriptional regulator